MVNLRRHHVLLAIDGWPGYLREMLDGALAYIEQHTEWRLVPDWRCSYADATVEGMPRVDGLIACHAGSPLTRTLIQRGCPTVCLQGQPRAERVTFINRDYRGHGRVALEHLRLLGFDRCVSVHTRDDNSPLSQRHAGFVEAACRADLACEQRLIELNQDGLMLRPREDHPQLRWVRDLEPPVALFTPRLAVARLLCHACQEAGWLVPEQVAVLAGGGDELMQRLSTPPISTVDQAFFRCGHEAARVLEQMLQGHPPPEPPVVVAPAGVTQRRSTDTLAIDHPAVAQAVRLIRDEACEGLTVAQLVRRVPLGRRALEQAFKRIVGRTLLQELRRVQVERARSLLRGTDLPTPDIAARCGFGHRSRFSHAFKAELGVSPMAFRRGADPEAD